MAHLASIEDTMAHYDLSDETWDSLPNTVCMAMRAALAQLAACQADRDALLDALRRTLPYLEQAFADPLHGEVRALVESFS